MKIKLQNKELTIREITAGSLKIAELTSDQILLDEKKSSIDFLVDLYYQGFDKIIIDEKNINPEFFDLKSRLAGDILQAVSNFRFQLSIKGDFAKYSSKSLNSFISESNNLGQIKFEKSE